MSDIRFQNEAVADEMVMLTVEEIESIHAELEQCLREVCGEACTHQRGQALAQECRSLFKRPATDPAAFDFLHGFIPLYERLERTLNASAGQTGTRQLPTAVVFS